MAIPWIMKVPFLYRHTAADREKCWHIVSQKEFKDYCNRYGEDPEIAWSVVDTPRSYDDLYEVAICKNYNTGWAYHQAVRLGYTVPERLSYLGREYSYNEWDSFEDYWEINSYAELDDMRDYL